VRAHLRSGGEIIGRIAGSDASAVTLEVGGDQQRLAYEEIAKARVEVEFSRPRGDHDEET
jgi:ribosome maturation factor RimP